MASGLPGLSGFPYGSLAVILSNVVNGKDSPTLLTAFTLNV